MESFEVCVLLCNLAAFPAVERSVAASLLFSPLSTLCFRRGGIGAGRTMVSLSARAFYATTFMGVKAGTGSCQ